MKWTMLTCGLVFALMFGGVAYGDYVSLVNVNLYAGPDTPMVGAAGAGSAGDVWNNIPGNDTTLQTNLVDDAGVATTVSFHQNTPENWVSTRSGTKLLHSYTTVRNSAQAGLLTSFELTGLNAGSEYDLYLYSVYDYDRPTPDTALSVSFTVGGETKTPIDHILYLDSYVENENYIVFRGLTGSTSINGTVDIPPLWDGIFGAFNGLQLAEVPEPATIGLLTIGFGLLYRRRR